MIYLIEQNGWVSHIKIVGDMEYHSLVLTLIADGQLYFENDKIKIKIEKVPYKLSKRLVVKKKGILLKTRLFKYKAAITTVAIPKETLYFRQGDEMARYSQTSISSTSSSRETPYKSWLSYTWEMLKSPLQ